MKKIKSLFDTIKIKIFGSKDKPETMKLETKITPLLCPECNNLSMIPHGRCYYCIICGHGECSL